MIHESKQNLKVMGETQSNGGTFEKVSIMGECNVTGSIEASTCKVMGECSVSEDLSCDYFRNMGEVTIGGRLAAAESRLIGETHVKGECALQQTSIYGELIAARNLTGEEMKVRGALHVAGNVSLETLDMQGGINVEGLLNCDDIDIVLKFNTENYVKEIGAGRVSVKRRRKLFSAALTHMFRSETIEGDHVSLEYTEAKVVRGIDVEIGEGCKIDRVEYSGSYKTSGRFKVGHAVRLAADKK
jgi:cytoskeletal protein CcmA (bactofilin family)